MRFLRFREDHAEVRAQFQNELNQLKAQIATCNNKSHAEYIVQDFVKRFERAKSDYRKTLKFFRKEDVCSLMSVGIPTSAAMLALPGLSSGDPYEPWRIYAGMLIGAVSALASREMGRKPKSIPSYLVGSERLSRFPGHTLHRKFEEFITTSSKPASHKLNLVIYGHLGLKSSNERSVHPLSSLGRWQFGSLVSHQRY